MDDTLPLDFGLVEIDEKTDGPTGGSQVVDTLRGVLTGQPFHTFQLDHQHVFDEQIGKVLSDRVTLVGDCKRSFGGRRGCREDRVLSAVPAGRPSRGIRCARVLVTSKTAPRTRSVSESN